MRAGLGTLSIPSAGGTYIHTHIQIHACMHACMHRYLHAYMSPGVAAQRNAVRKWSLVDSTARTYIYLHRHNRPNRRMARHSVHDAQSAGLSSFWAVFLYMSFSEPSAARLSFCFLFFFFFSWLGYLTTFHPMRRGNGEWEWGMEEFVVYSPTYIANLPNFLQPCSRDPRRTRTIHKMRDRDGRLRSWPCLRYIQSITNVNI